MSRPTYYKPESDIDLDPWKIIKAYNLDFWEGNVLKYLLRWRKKGGVADLFKAKAYIEELIWQHYRENGVND